MKSLFEQNGGTYRGLNDYRVPNLTLPNESEYTIGVWGRRRLNYIKHHRKTLYTNLLTSGKLNEHIREIDEIAQERREIIIQQLMAAQDMTERLKAENQLLWVGKLNNIRACADEIIYNELI